MKKLLVIGLLALAGCGQKYDCGELAIMLLNAKDACMRGHQASCVDVSQILACMQGNSTQCPVN